MKKDILSCSQTYKSLPGLLQLRPDSWMEGRNEVLSHAVGALCHSGIKDVQKTVAVDQLYSLVQPSYVSPFLFGANLLVYSIARSKLAMNIYNKFFPAGASSCNCKILVKQAHHGCSTNAQPSPHCRIASNTKILTEMMVVD